MNKFIPLSSLKDTTGIVELCKKAGEPVVVNRNGELKLVIMIKDIFGLELYVMSYKEYLRRKAVITLVELGILQETTNAARNRVFAYEEYLGILRKDT